MNEQEIREIGDEFPSCATEPPQHPNCRGVLVPVVGDTAKYGGNDKNNSE